MVFLSLEQKLDTKQQVKLVKLLIDNCVGDVQNYTYNAVQCKNPWPSVLIILDLIMIIDSVIDKHGDDLHVC